MPVRLKRHERRAAWKKCKVRVRPLSGALAYLHKISMATADTQVKCFIIRLDCVVGHKVDYYTGFYLLFSLLRRKGSEWAARSPWLIELLIQQRGRREGSQGLCQDSIAGQRGHAVNWTTRRLSQNRLAYVKLFHIIQAFPERLYMQRQSLCSGPFGSETRLTLKSRVTAGHFITFKQRKTKEAVRRLKARRRRMGGQTQQVSKQSDAVFGWCVFLFDTSVTWLALCLKIQFWKKRSLISIKMSNQEIPVSQELNSNSLTTGNYELIIPAEKPVM